MLKLLLEMAARLPAENVGDNLSEAQALANEIMARVRNTSLNLRSAILDDLGLLSQANLIRYSRRRGILRWRIDCHGARLGTVTPYS